jgi:transposase InsO family protein
VASGRFLIFDRDAKYGAEVPAAIRPMKIKCVRTSLRSPWQNGVAEGWIGSCRRDLLDHIIAFDERHLKRWLSEYFRYYHEDRTHLGLRKGTPNNRPRSMASGRMRDWAGCIIVTIGLPDPKRVVLKPHARTPSL